MEKNSVGKKLRERRSELSITQKQVADYVGVTEATVSRWESGEIDNMRRDKIARLASVLQVSPLLIMGLPEEKQPDDLTDVNEEKILLKGYRSLDNSKKRVLFSMLDFLNSPQSSATNSIVQNNKHGNNIYANGGENSYNFTATR